MASVVLFVEKMFFGVSSDGLVYVEKLLIPT